jgi:hypothetical protein
MDSQNFEIIALRETERILRARLALLEKGLMAVEWGAGPFTICAGGKLYRFEDSDMFGPIMIKKDGDPKKWQPGQYHPFWDAHRAWWKQGRRTIGEGYCVYDTERAALAALKEGG